MGEALNGKIMEHLSQPAKRLIVCVAAVAWVVVVTALLEWNGGHLLKLAIWLLVAALAGTVKLRFPAVDSCYSLGYIVVLAGMSMLGFSDLVLVSLVTALVQCYWHASKRPMAVQLVFNLGNYAISAAVSWYAFRALGYLDPDLSIPARFTLGAGVFFLINTGLVSWILALLAGKRLMEIWEKSHLLIFPFYLIGAGCAAMVAWQQGAVGWSILAVLPLLFLAIASLRSCFHVLLAISQRLSS